MMPARSTLNAMMRSGIRRPRRRLTFLSEDDCGIRAAEVARQCGHVPRKVEVDGVLHVASGREHGKFAVGVGQRRTRWGLEPLRRGFVGG